MMKRLFHLTVTMAAAASFLAAQAAPARQPYTFLREKVGLTQQEYEAAASGNPFTKIIKTPKKPEVVVFGVVFIRAKITDYVEMYRHIERFGKTSAYLGVGKFSDPPRVSDLADLSLDKKDLKELKGCKPGDCAIQLPGYGIENFRREIDWTRPDVMDQANRLMRKLIVAGLKRYQKEGNKALGTYEDKKTGINVAKTFADLISRWGPAFEPVPAFRRYLLDYPDAKLPGAEEFFYWEKVKFGLQPTIRINHLILYKVPKAKNSPYVLASKQLYANHYFQTALDLSFCVPDTARPEKDGFFLLTLKGSRQDGLTGFGGSILRSIVVKRVRGSLESGLLVIKKSLETH